MQPVYWKKSPDGNSHPGYMELLWRESSVQRFCKYNAAVQVAAFCGFIFAGDKEQ